MHRVRSSSLSQLADEPSLHTTILGVLERDPGSFHETKSRCSDPCSSCPLFNRLLFDVMLK